MRLKSPAKINLHLRIGPLAADGFHPLLSWMCSVGFFDTMDFRAAKTPGIRLTCNRPDVPVDQTNLIVRAANALLGGPLPENKRDGRSYSPPLSGAGKRDGRFSAPYLSGIIGQTPGAQITLHKKIPMGGGLGGGSSNAATALVGLNQLWKLDLNRDRLSHIGAALGSDVAFFLHGNSAICTGRGEIVRPIDPPDCRWAVLIFPDLSMPTPLVYRRFDEMGLGAISSIESQPDWRQWTNLRAGELLPKLVNDLESPAFAISPELGELRKKIEQNLGRIVRMSGSGSTLFTLFDDQQEANIAAEKVRGLEVAASAVELAPR